MKKILIHKTYKPVRYLMIFFSLIITICLFAGGCSDGDGDGDSDDTQSLLCPNGSYSDTQEQYLTDSMYKLLGMLDEYISRFSYITGEPYPDRVESFYPSETDLADYFEDIILEYQAENQAQFEYTRETISQGHIYFYSTDLSAIINSFYIKPDGSLATLDKNVFCMASEENLLSYVESAYMRYGIENKNRIDMANAAYKLVTIGCVLKELGCSNIAVYTTSGEGAAPTSFTVFFNPNELVANRLGIQQIVTETEITESDYVLYEIIE